MNPIITYLISLVRAEVKTDPAVALSQITALVNLIVSNPTALTLIAPYLPEQYRPLLGSHAATVVALVQADLAIIEKDPSFLTAMLTAAGR